MVTGALRRSILPLLLVPLVLPCAFAGSPSQFAADASLHRWAAYYFPYEDWRWFKAQATAESNLDQAARSYCGAIGIMQLMPATAQGLGINPYDPDANIQGGIKYDASLFSLWKAAPGLAERRNLMFASYNAGPGSIQRASKAAGSIQWAAVAAALPTITGRHAAETTQYVARIEQYYAGMK
jgi:soluble lytic murein transglycosylase-like protein